MEAHLSAEAYEVARWLLQRGVALVALLAFVNVLCQWRPLLGERGLLPVTEILRDRPSLQHPSLFHWRYSDRLVTGVGAIGVAVASSLLVGLPQRGPWWVPMVAFLVLWVLYLAVATTGRIFYAFGWESLLLESLVLVAFLGSADTAPPWTTLLAARWLLFRVELGAGLIKWRGDRCWRELTCLEHHHETQPMPGPLSRLFHLLPRPVHKAEVAANHVAQLLVPFGLFLPQPVAGTAAAIIVATQAWLMLSGNFAWLNLLTIVLAASALPDPWFGWVGTVGEVAPTPVPLLVLAGLYALVVVVLSLRGAVPNLLSRRQRMNTSHDPLRLVNSYGAFGSVTRRRDELWIEATRDPDPLAGDDGEVSWEPYGFKGKPGDPARLPRQFAPYHLRLDWLLWFAAMDPVPTGHRWFVRLLEHLLRADPAVLRLLRHDPMGGRPPTAIRVRRVGYRFATRAERRATGQRWILGEPVTVVPPIPADRLASRE